MYEGDGSGGDKKNQRKNGVLYGKLPGQVVYERRVSTAHVDSPLCGRFDTKDSGYISGLVTRGRHERAMDRNGLVLSDRPRLGSRLSARDEKRHRGARREDGADETRTK